MVREWLRTFGNWGPKTNLEFVHDTALGCCVCVAPRRLFGGPVAEELAPEQARAFVVGKLFHYTCFDGTAGMGRDFADGSVVGTVQAPGRKMAKFAVLPPGTIRVAGKQVCAHLSGFPIDPCFKLEKLSHPSFRGSLLVLNFALLRFLAAPNPRAQLISSNAARPSAVPTSAVAKLRPSLVVNAAERDRGAAYSSSSGLRFTDVTEKAGVGTEAFTVRVWRWVITTTMATPICW